MLWGLCQKCCLVGFGPYFVGSRSAIETPAALARVRRNKTTIKAPRENSGKYGPGVVCLPSSGLDGDAVAPRHKDPAGPAISQRAQRKIGKGPLDSLDERHVTTACALGQILEIR